MFERWLGSVQYYGRAMLSLSVYMLLGIFARNTDTQNPLGDAEMDSWRVGDVGIVGRLQPRQGTPRDVMTPDFVATLPE